ncbi:MAG: hypothetical protein B2I17_00700 [Thermoplasmatales archaeon B_DKE]|nr:MAG: hypothetical protein B2I17_00700 [Thermoplasmatales archaeon B_DKE]QRF75620.1 D-tyrosyl-tRNA(Tyr) deacylase [Thermoplasmatales archaeon]
MIFIISSRSDEASTSLGQFLLDRYGFQPDGNSGNLFKQGEFTLQFINERHLYYEGFEADVKKLGNVEAMIILSRHSSVADIKSLTVHPTGNFDGAKLGGVPGRLSMTNPAGMTDALRAIRKNYHGLDFEVTLEATHHGPLTMIPHYYVEIGTTKEQWENTDALSAVCSAILDRKGNSYKNYVGVGGGHYMPKITKYVLENEVNVGHLLPKYHHEAIGEDMIRQCVEMTPGCSGFIVDRKGTKSRVREMLETVSGDMGLQIIQI